jgi:hypothetical protein
MYPEVNHFVQKRLTDRITKAQLDNEKPSYKVRQGLSMLLGTNLDSTLTPANMQAAQSVFAPQQAAAQQPSAPAGKSKKSTSSLTKVADQYKTGDQAAASRAQQT